MVGITRVRRNGLWKKRNLPDFAQDTFVLGQTNPINNPYPFTAVSTVGPRVPETSMQNYAGSLTNVDRPLDRLIITGQFNPNIASCEIVDSIVLGGEPNPAGADPLTRDAIWPLFDMRRAIQTDIKITHCEARPSYTSHEIYGVKGGNVTAYRSVFRGSTDGFQPHGSGSTDAAPNKFFKAHGCLIENLAIHTDPGQPDLITHNDGSQSRGLLTLLEIWGCAFVGGRTSALLVQPNDGSYKQVRIIYNWLYGHPTLGSTINITEWPRTNNPTGVIGATDGTGTGTVPGLGLEIGWNRIDRNGKSPRILVPVTTKNHPLTYIHDNVFMDDGSPVPISNG